MMDADTDKSGGSLVEVRVGLLFAVIKAVIEDGIDADVLHRYGDEVVLMTPDQAKMFKAFVHSDVTVHNVQPGQLEPANLVKPRTKLVGPKLKAALPDDCAECQPRH